MPCLLTSGINLSCRDKVGGIKSVLLTNIENKNNLTKTGNEITDFDLAVGKQFWAYEQEIEKAFLTENIVTSRENGTLFFEQDLTMSVYLSDADTISEIQLLAQSRLMIIIEDNNGQYKLMGEVNGAMLEPSTYNTGTAFGDMNGYTLVLKAKEPHPMAVVDSTLIPSLIIPAV